MGKYKDAISGFNKAIELDNRNAEAYCRRGVVYLYLGKFDKAIKDMEYGLVLDPSLKPDVKDYLEEAKKLKEENE
jgi:tetratricopeptide (TPR) repeat protein